MKRLFLGVATLSLAGCPGSPVGTCPPSQSTIYVDTQGFDDGGYQDQACASCLQTEVCTATPFDLGVAQVMCQFHCRGGRRPDEWVRADVRAREVVGAWLANAAQLEAASVPAFEILARELRAHDAPTALIARALK
ncbi:MAG TPA: hypothetical protein VGH63_09300, partial [Polyangia bacterium]